MTCLEELYSVKEPRIFYRNSYYHAYNRGNHYQKIFYEEKDYKNFLHYLRYAEKITTVEIYGYCLMPNHYHLLLRLGSNERDFSKFFHSSMTSYSMYFNKRYHQVGRLCQDRYQYRWLPGADDIYKIKHYLRQNPVKAGLVQNSEDYKWLSIYEG